MKAKVKVRPLYEICEEIREDWQSMPNYAKEHFKAIECATSIDEMYGFDSVESEVCYFLSSASTWKGEVARRVKLELKALVGLK